MTSTDAAAADDPVGPASAPRRLHPAGPLVGFFAGLPQLIFPVAAGTFGTRNLGIGLPWIILGVLGIALAFRWLAWLRFHYTIGADDIRIERGWIGRAARAIPYDRIQDVSIEQRPLPRLFGLAEVTFETGGGKGDEARLSYVSVGEAARLRETVRARRGAMPASDVDDAADASPEVGDDHNAPLFAMDLRRVLTLGFYSFSLIALALLAGAAQQFDGLISFDLWDWQAWQRLIAGRGIDVTHLSRATQIGGTLAVLAGLVVLGGLTGMIRTVLSDYGFRLDRTPKGLRRRRGLITRTDVVMPTARVQAAVVGTGPIRRRRGWHALHFVSLAQDGAKGSHHAVAPLARLDEIWPIAASARLVAPAADLAFFRAGAGPRRDLWLIAAVLGAAGLIAFAFATGTLAWPLWLAGLGALAAWLWLRWSHRSAAVDGEQLYARDGWWRQDMMVARQINVQSVRLQQGPLLRRHGLADISFGVAGGVLEFSALPLAQAEAIRAQVLTVVGPIDFSAIDAAG